MAFSVACAQFAPQKKALQANLDRIAEILSQASIEGVDLVVFPETCTTGYFLEGGVLELAMSAGELAEALGSRLRDLKHPIDAVIGFYERASGSLYNSAATIAFSGVGAEVVHCYRKFFLPTYGVFDEERFVNSGHELGVFGTRMATMGVLICEDVWHSVMPALCAVGGMQLLAVPAASPARGFHGKTVENHDRYERMLRALCEEHGVFCANAQLVGFEGGKGFVGGSMVVDPFGRVLASAELGEEALIVAEIDLDLIDLARSQSPLLNDLSSRWSDIVRLVSQFRN